MVIVNLGYALHTRCTFSDNQITDQIDINRGSPPRMVRHLFLSFQITKMVF